MPFYSLYILMGYWKLGPVICDLWLSVDYTVCLVSQYTVLLITIDRYCSVKIAARYRGWRTKNKVIWMVAITWIVPALLFFISIFGWEHFVGYRDLLPGQCAVQFLKDPVFNTALIIGYYWTTLVVLFVLYGGIYKVAYEMQKKSEAKQRKMRSMVALSAGAMQGMAGRAAGLDSKVITSENNTKVCHGLTEGGLVVGQQSSGGESTSGQNISSKCTTSSYTATINPRDKRTEVTVEKERSSSPTFESDDESSSNNMAPSAWLLRRKSVAGLLVQSALVSPHTGPGILQRSCELQNELLPKFGQARGSPSPVTEMPKEPPPPPPPPPRVSNKATTNVAYSQVDKEAPPPPSSSSLSLPLPSSLPLPLPLPMPMPMPLSLPLPLPLSSSPQPKDQAPILCNGVGNRFGSEPEPEPELESDVEPANSPIETLAGSTPDQFSSKTLTPLPSPDSPEERSFSEKWSASSSLRKMQRIITPPSQFRTSAPTSASASVSVSASESSSSNVGRPRSLLVGNSSAVTYDMLVGLDTADLKYMDESSIIIPSPNIESPPSSLSFPNTSSTGPPSPVHGVAAAATSSSTSSLLQAALLRAAAQQMLSGGGDGGGSKSTNTSQPPPVSKVDTAVTVNLETDRASTTVVTVVEQQVDQQPSPDAAATPAAIISSSTSTWAASETAVASAESAAADADESGSGEGAPPVATKCKSAKKSSTKEFMRSIGSRFKNKKRKTGPLFGRQKSRSENRARKAFRTISFILGAFVACWTPYHVLALVEGFCKNPPCTNEHLYLFSYFLCYANSPINPFCYALANHQFKRTFTRILKGDFHMT